MTKLDPHPNPQINREKKKNHSSLNHTKIYQSIKRIYK